MPRLSAKNLQKTYQGKKIVDKVSLELKAGEVIGLLGPNGAGKTTCFYMMAGLISPDSGEVLMNGVDMTDQPMHVRAKAGLGYLAQEPSIFRRLSVKDNVLAILENREDLSKPEQLALCGELLAEFGIHHLADNKAFSLSGGERRRLEIARALAVEPKFMLLDEPFAGVDPISIIEIQKIIKHLSERKIGILITDHNVRETLGICQKAYILAAGKVLTNGEPQEILDDPNVRSIYLGENFRL
tara:strand:- start:2700 stop:3425 length:726 start_codon:yes stop_codon:yes gene_type:complete